MDPASLVLGCAGLVTVFDSCMSAFEYFDTGRQYGEDYQRAALRVELLRLKLTRWRACVYLVEKPSLVDQSKQRSHHLCYAPEQDALTAKRLLGDIGMLLERAEQKSLQHGPVDPPGSGIVKSGDSMEGLIAKTKQLCLNRQKSSSLARKARWALHDKKKLDNLVMDLTTQVGLLLELFPALQFQQDKLAKDDVVEIIEPSEVEEAGEPVKQLEDASKDVDQDLLRAVEFLRGHTYTNTIARGNARLLNGDSFLEKGYRVTGRRHEYNGVYVEGNAKVQNGDQYGGKGIFDD